MQLVHHVAYLVNGTSRIVGPCAPLVAIHGSQFTVLIGPLVPDAHPMFLQIAHIRVTLQEPQQFVHDALEMEFLGGEQGKSLLQIETHLVAEEAHRARARAVALERTLTQDAVQQV